MRARLAPAALVAALLVATSAAFVVTEKLKLTRSPIIGPTVAKVFSPVCDCDTSAAEIRFRLRKPDRVSVAIVDSGGDVVRELARDRRQGRRFVTYLWDGRDAAGRVVAEGTYRPRVHLDAQRRTIVMPNRIRVDTTPPRVTTFIARPLVISPDGDGRFDRAKIRYRLDERAAVELYVGGVRALRRLGTRTSGTMDWFGTAGGEPLPEGPHTLRLVARDLAGNLGPRSGSRTVAIRFLALGRDRVADDTRRAVRDPGRLPGADAPLDAGAALGRRAAGDTPASSPREARSLRAARRRERPREARRRRRPESRAVNAAAQVASVVGCAGLVAVYLAPSRAARLAGLVAWGTGLGVLGVTCCRT